MLQGAATGLHSRCRGCCCCITGGKGGPRGLRPITRPLEASTSSSSHEATQSLGAITQTTCATRRMLELMELW